MRVRDPAPDYDGDVKEGPIFKGPLPQGNDPPAGNAQISQAVEWVESLLAQIEGLILGAPAPGNIVVVSGTSDPVYKAVTGDIAVNAAGVASIGAGKVLEAMLGGEAVATAKIKALAVTAAKIAAEAVETAKLAGLSVTEAKIAALAVSTAKLAAEAVETGKIKNAAVTDAKLASPTLARNDVIWRGCGRLVGKGAVGDFVLSAFSNQWVKSNAVADGDAIDGFRLSAADVFVPNKTAKLMVRFAYFAPNGVAPGVELKTLLSELGESGPHWVVSPYHETQQVVLPSAAGLQRSDLSNQISIVNYGLGEGKTVTNQIITPSVHLTGEMATENLTIWAEILLTYV